MYQSSTNDDKLIKNNVMNDEINRLLSFQKLLREDDSKIKEIIANNSSFNNEDFSVNLNDLKAILFEISTFFQVNLETFLESYMVKFRDNELISYFDFMNYFIENLEKQEKILAAINMNNSVDLNNQNYFNGDLTENFNQNMSLDNNDINNSMKQKNDFDYQENKINSINLNNLNETDNLFLMILHRSLYILKKKFEFNTNEIKNIYEEHSEKGKFNKIINIDNFISVLDKIFKTCKINFLDINQPSDLFKAEIIEDYSDEKLNMIEKQIKNFMLNNRKFYNDRFKYKREKEFFEIFLKERGGMSNSINNQNESLNNNTATENPTPKNPNNKGGKKANNKLNESTNNANMSMNESKVSKFNDLKRKESNANIANPSKNAKPNAGNTSTKNLNVSQSKDLGTSKSKIVTKNTLKKNPAQESSNSIMANKDPINDENNDNNLQDLNNNLNENLIDNNDNLNDNKDNMMFGDPNNLSKSQKDNVIGIENIEEFRVKKLDEEIRTVILDNNSDIINKNKNKYQDNSLKYLISDAIPLIIADFIHENINIAILDMSNDLKSDLRGLFDKEIIKKIEEASQYDTENEKVLKLKEYLFEKLNTQKNIKIYEDLFLTKKTQGENTSHILNILEKLRNHLSLIDKKIKFLQNGENNFNNSMSYEKSQTIIENILNLNNNGFDNSVVNYNGSPTGRGQKTFVSKIIPKKNKTKEELRIDNFKQIFDFYAKQHQFTSKNATFEEIQEKFNLMVLGEFNKFAIEFKIPLKKEVVTEIFKKHAKNAKDMHFEEFMQALDKMSTRINEEKIKTHLAKIKKLRAILAGKETGDGDKDSKTNKNNINRNPTTNLNNKRHSEIEQEKEVNQEEENENNNEEKENNEGSSNLVLENNNSINLNMNENQDNQENDNSKENSQKNPTAEEISKTQKIVFELKKKTQSDLLNELYDTIQIDDQKAYQQKMKGFVLPFNSDKVNIRLPYPENSPKRVIKTDPISQENLKRILKERKEQKLKELEEKEKLEKINMLENKKKAKIINEKLKTSIANNEKLYSTKDKVPVKYAEIKKKQENIIKEKETKLTWDQLENLNFNHFITNREDDFNPNELFDELYDSDDENIFDEIQNTEKNTINNKTKKSKDTSSYLNIQTNLNLINNNTNLNNNSKTIINLNSSVNESIPDTIIKSYSGKTRGSSNVNYSAKGYNNNDINIQTNHIASNNVKNINNRKPSTIQSPSNKASIHSSHDNISNLSFLDNETSRPSHKNNRNINDSYELHKRSPRNRSPKTRNPGNLIGINNNNNPTKILYNNDKQIVIKNNNKIQRDINNSAKKILNRSIERSAGAIKNNRSSSKSNIYINPNQKYAGIQSPKSIKGLNNDKINKQLYSIEKTEKMAREMEKNREDQKSRLMKKHDDLVKKSIDKIKKYL